MNIRKMESVEKVWLSHNNPIKILMLDELKEKAAGLMENENVKGAVDKAKELINSGKGKEVMENVKEKAETFIHNKFGRK